jgi:hypothetical protein
MQQDVLLPFDLPAVARKKVSVAFDGGMLSSDVDCDPSCERQVA